MSPVVLNINLPYGAPFNAAIAELLSPLVTICLISVMSTIVIYASLSHYKIET